MSQPRTNWRVQVVMPLRADYPRRVMRGVAEYAQRTGVFHLLPAPREDDPSELLGPDKADALLFQGRLPRLTQAVLADPRPKVLVTSEAGSLGAPRVQPDNVAIGRLGFEHLCEQGLEQFAFFGMSERWFAARRCEGFAAAAAEAGFPHPEVHDSGTRSVDAWLKLLPRPCGLMCANDAGGAEILRCAEELGIAVPDALAVLGVDNDLEPCLFSVPTLSSIDQAGERQGLEAARLLHDLLLGRNVPELTTISPAGVTQRRSTLVVPGRDVWVREAMRFIQEQAATPLSVDDVVKAAGISRRNLEQRFREDLDSTIHRQIQQARLRQSRRLLVDTTLSLTQISERLGFRYPSHFSAWFRRESGQTPSEHRARFHQPHR